MAEITTELYLDSTGYNYIRQQMQDRILTPHGITPERVEHMQTAELFALLVQKSTLAFPVTVGPSGSAYKYHKIDAKDVSYEFTRSSGIRGETARLIDDVINPLHVRHSGSLKIIGNQGGGSRRTGNTAIKAHQRIDVDKVIDFMATKLANRELDLGHLRPQFSEDRQAIFAHLKEVFCDAIGIPPESTKMGFAELLKAALVTSNAPMVDDHKGGCARDINGDPCTKWGLQEKTRLPYAVIQHRQGLRVGSSKPQGTAGVVADVLKDPESLADMYARLRPGTDAPQVMRDSMVHSIGKVLVEEYGLDPYSIPGVERGATPQKPVAQAAMPDSTHTPPAASKDGRPDLTVTLAGHYVYPLNDNKHVRRFMELLKYRTRTTVGFTADAEGQSQPTVALRMRRVPEANNALVADVFVAKDAPNRENVIGTIRDAVAQSQQPVMAR